MYFVLSFITLVGVFFMSCNPKENSNNERKTLKLNCVDGDPPSLHPASLQLSLRGHVLASLLFEGLTRFNEKGEIELAGALSYETPSDRHYVFTLRDNYWSDGTAVTAQDFVESWQYALLPGSNCPRADLLYMIKGAQAAKKGEIAMDQVGIKALNEKQISIELAYPSPYFLELLTQPIFAPLHNPSHILEQNAAEPKNSNGAFQVEEWKRTCSLCLKPNPFFWNHSQVNLEKIQFFFVQDSTTSFYMYEKGEIDWMGDPLIMMNEELTAALRKNHSPQMMPVTRFFWLFFNTRHPLLASASIRKALSTSIDRKEAVAAIFANKIPLWTAFSCDQKAAIRDDALQTLFAQGLEELGFSKQNLPSICISYSQDPERKKFAEYLQELWQKKFGLRVSVTGTEWNTFLGKLQKGDFDIGGLNNTMYYDPIDILGRFLDLNAGNYSHWVSAPFQDRLRKAQNERDLSKRTLFLKEAEEILMDQMPFAPICRHVGIYAHPPTLKGYRIDAHSGNVDFAYSRYD